MRALMIGRFQPFHRGHLKVVREILAEAEDIIIGIGSAQYSHSLENPFTAGERHLMISKSLELEGINNYFLVPIIDIHRYSVWVAHVESLVPPFDVVYSKSPLTSRLFNEAGHNTKEPFLYDRENYSGKEIRRRMLAGEEWRSLVPKGTSEVIDEMDGVERLKDISKGDYDEKKDEPDILEREASDAS